MLTVFIWLVEVVYIVLEGINVVTYFQLANEFSKYTEYAGDFSGFFVKSGIGCIVGVVASLVFCVYITIAYEKAHSNEEYINRIIEKFRPKKKNALPQNDNEKVYNVVKIVENDNVEKMRAEIDDNIENIAKEDECPVCFHHINKDDKTCSNCGNELK